MTKSMRPSVLRRFLADEEGATAIDYGVLACIMSVVVVAFAASGLSPGGIIHKLSALATVLTRGMRQGPPDPDGEF